MKKKNRNILVMLGVLLLMGAAAAALLLTQPKSVTEKEESSSSSSAAGTISVIEKSLADVSNIQVKNTEGSFLMVAEQTAADPDKKIEASTTFTLQGFEHIPMKDVTISSAASTVLPLVAVKEIEKPENLDDFGLSGEGKATLALTYTDGSKDTLVIGNASAGTTGYYMMKDGKVYIGTTVSENLLKSPLNFVATTVLAVPDVTTTDEKGNTTPSADDLTNLTLSGSHFPQPIEIGVNTSTISGVASNRIFSPVEADTNSTGISAIATAVKNVSATGAVQVNPKAEDLAHYGLAEPYAKIVFTLNGENHTLAVSAVNEKGNRYLMSDNTPVVYEVTAASVAAWADTSLTNLRATYIFLASIQEVNKLTFTENGEVTSFAVNREKDEEKSTEDNVKYNIIPSLDGAEIDYPQTYQPLYSDLLSLPVLSSDPVVYDNSKTPVLTVEYQYFEGTQADRLTFYAVDGQDRYAAELNGKYSGILRKTSIDDFIATLHKARNKEILKVKS